MTEQHPITPPDDTSYEFIVSNDVYCVEAIGSAPTVSQAVEKGKHYLAQYSQDGHYTLKVRRVEVVYKLSTEQLINRALEALPDD